MTFKHGWVYANCYEIAAGPIGEALGPLISSVTQLWATVLAL